MPDEAEDAALRSHQDGLLAGVERSRDLARQTQNPIFAWQAVMFLAWIRQHQTSQGKPPGDLVIPAWCADYFGDLAQTLTFLAEGQDIRRDPEEEAPELPPEEAMALVSFALGFTRKGFNAFTALRGARDQMAAFRRYEELREAGMQYGPALRVLAEETGAKEESVLRRRVTAGRRLAKGERPEEGEATGKT